ncbi:MAG: glyoxalase [Acidobacteria bacterium]|nr:MAG: glyoxalase [Acidobacteriota bacterium]REK05580.1 MAG: glyoxalase [Acidobacteriota bacterium]
MSRIVPCLRYRDAPAALDFLCRAFGFEVHQRFDDEADPSVVQHAELRLGDQLVMVSSVVRDTEFSKVMTTVSQAGGNTMTIYLALGAGADLEAHAERARAAGADVFMPVEDHGYGHGYSARDPEAHVWSVGDYDPLAG